MTGSRAPRCRVDLKKWKTRRDEWMQLLKQSLEQEDTSREGPRDPFQALKHAEVVAEEIARKLAPKRIPKAGELRRSFCFAGHRLLLRELNWLRETRVLVESALSGSAEFWSCPQRAVKWTVLASQLPQWIQRSGFPRSPEGPRPPFPLARESHGGPSGRTDVLGYACKDSVRGTEGSYPRRLCSSSFLECSELPISTHEIRRST